MNTTGRTRDRTAAWMLAALAPLLSLLVIRPWTPSAFPVWDYDDMLPLLRPTRTLWDGFVALARFTRADGRANYLTYLQLAGTWRIARDNPVLWQWSRAILMLAAGLLLLAVARRLGGKALAAAIGAAILMISVSGTEGWLFIMGEPLALVLLLLLILASAGYRTTPHWRSRAVVIAVLCAGVMVAKEVLALCLPAVIVFAVCWIPETGFTRPAWGKRERWLAALLGVVIALQAWSVVSALHDAMPGAYATSFGRGGVSGTAMLTLFQSMLLPDRFFSASSSSDLYPANVAFGAVLIFGLISWWNRGADKSGGAWIVGLLSYPALGAVTYALWPRYSAFYGLPFFAGSVGLLVAAASELDRHQRTGRLMIAVLGAVAIGYTALVSYRTTGYKRAIADVAATVVRTLGHEPRLDSIFIVVPTQGERRWPISAKELQHYAVALQVPDSMIPIMLETNCVDAAARLRRPLDRDGLLDDQNPCGALPAATVTWTAPVPYWDWMTFRRGSDSVNVQLLAPAWKTSH